MKKKPSDLRDEPIPQAINQLGIKKCRDALAYLLAWRENLVLQVERAAKTLKLTRLAICKKLPPGSPPHTGTYLSVVSRKITGYEGVYYFVYWKYGNAAINHPSLRDSRGMPITKNIPTSKVASGGYSEKYFKAYFNDKLGLRVPAWELDLLNKTEQAICDVRKQIRYLNWVIKILIRLPPHATIPVSALDEIAALADGHSFES